jgi:hypothetical protein
MGCMMTNIIVVRGQRCRRSDLIVRALQAQGIPFCLVQAEGEEDRH